VAYMAELIDTRDWIGDSRPVVGVSKGSQSMDAWEQVAQMELAACSYILKQKPVACISYRHGNGSSNPDSPKYRPHHSRADFSHMLKKLEGWGVEEMIIWSWRDDTGPDDEDGAWLPWELFLHGGY